MKPVILLSLFFSVLGSFQLFDLIIPLTGGDPAEFDPFDGVVPLHVRHQEDAPRLWQRRCAHPVCDLCRGNGWLQTIFAPGGSSELDLCGCEFHYTLTIVGWYFSLLPDCAYFPSGRP